MAATNSTSAVEEKELWFFAGNLCAIQFVNCTEEILYPAESSIEVGCLSCRINHDCIRPGDKGAAQVETGQVSSWYVQLVDPLAQDVGFGDSWYRDGKEYVVIGTRTRCGELGGVAAPAGSGCLHVIASCCKEGGNQDLCIEHTFSAQATVVNSVTFDGVVATGPWVPADYANAVTGIAASLQAAGVDVSSVVWDSVANTLVLKGDAVTAQSVVSVVFNE